MANDAKKAALAYIEQVLEDEEKLGYTGKVSTEVRAEATRKAERALKELERAVAIHRSLAA
jgi:hypothetical protein